MPIVSVKSETLDKLLKLQRRDERLDDTIRRLCEEELAWMAMEAAEEEVEDRE